MYRKICYLTVLFYIINSLWATGQSNQFKNLTGDFYDNRDNNHANMPLTDHPGLTYMSSGYNIQEAITPNLIVFGNASLAYTSGYFWGSLIRVRSMRSQYGMTKAYDLYTNNNAYWYPEHRDHDAVDYYFTQAPMFNNSQGSSSSEIDEMHKWFYTLDSFNAATKTYLKNNNLLIPTMQLIARRSRVNSDAEYLTGVAHPNAFDNADVRTEMETMASNMTTTTIPPMVQIVVETEDYNKAQAESNYYLFEPVVGQSKKENFTATPVSITRLWHGLGYTKRIVVSAESSYDANTHPLTYHWAILRGESAHITINPLNASSSRVEILIDYHSETTIAGETRLTNLVSIGAFVHNGHHYSAPAFVTSYTKRNEVRVYDINTDNILSITYNNNNLDPSVSREKDWDSDVFSYDTNDMLTGWIRTKGAIQDRFTKEGYVVEAEVGGNPTMVSKVSYQVGSNNKTVWVRVGAPFAYSSTAAVAELEKFSYITLYPNPIKADYVTIDFSETAQAVPNKIEVYTIGGKLVKEIETNNFQTRIDTREFSDATYIFRVYFMDDKNRQQIKNFTVVR